MADAARTLVCSACGAFLIARQRLWPMMMSLQPSPGRAPRKKFRGKKRYFRSVQRAAAEYSFSPELSRWWDYWHYHADWPGWGNVSWAYRRAHIAALCLVFSRIFRARDRMPGPFQVWFFFDMADAGADAVFVHSPTRMGPRSRLSTRQLFGTTPCLRHSWGCTCRTST